MPGLIVFSVLPISAFLLWSRARVPDWRSAAVCAAVGWAAGVALITEALGIFHAFHFWPVLIVWLMVNASVLGLAWRTRQIPQRPTFGGVGEIVLACVIVAMLALALVVAVVAPPNTPDVLAYHLPRQLMWLQQGGLQHFITADERALMMPPLGEMIQAHALLLSGGDRWANLPQWLAYGLGLIVASLLARELGASRRTQWLAAFVFATTPMAWHEATSAKNDLLVAVWLGVLAWLALRLSQTERPTAADWCAAGAALGVSLATKTTALLFCVAPLLLILPVALREWRRAWLVPALALLIAGPHAARNTAWYGTPLGEQPAAEGGGQGTEIISVRAAASNLLRNATLHLATPSTAINDRVSRVVALAHRWMGQDLNDRRTTLWFLQYGVEWGPEHEAIAGAPAQFILGIGALVVWLVRPGWRRIAWRTVFIGAAGILLLVVMLKWQPAGARLQLPIFLVLSALIASAAEGFGLVGFAVVALACLAAWLPASETQLRPWRTTPTIFATSRWENYFRFHPRERLYVEKSLSALAATQPKTLQIISRHAFPYPLMTGFLSASPTAKFWGGLPQSASVPPDAVLVIEPTDRPFPPEFTPAGATEPYRLVGGLEPYALYVPALTSAALPAVR